MGDQCGVPVAASTRREKAREADVVGYCPFAKHQLERACVYRAGQWLAHPLNCSLPCFDPPSPPACLLLVITVSNTGYDRRL